MDYDGLTVNKEAGIATLTLNRPEQLNAISLPVAQSLEKALDDIDAELRRRAQVILDEGVKMVDSLDDGLKLLDSGWDGIIKTNWCGEMDCAEEMEKGLDRTFLGYPLKDVDSGEEERHQGNCMFCGRPTEKVVYISKSY